MDLDELVGAALQGGPDPWTEIGTILYPMLYRYFGRELGSHDAQDLAQATLLAAYLKLPTYEPRGPDSFRKWVFGIARIELLDARRKRHHHQRRLGAAARGVQTPSRSPSSVLAWAERGELLEHELAELPARYRQAIENELVDGTGQQLAELAGVKLNYAFVLIRRARELVARRVLARAKTPRAWPEPPRAPTKSRSSSPLPS